MRGAARGLIVAIIASVLVAGAACAMQSPPGFGRAVRELDGGQFIEDEPIWLCDDGEPDPGDARGDLLHDFRIVGVDDRGRQVPAPLPPELQHSEPSLLRLDLADMRRSRAGEFVHSFAYLPARAELHALGHWRGQPGGLRAGRYEVRRGLMYAPRSTVDTAAVIARFRVLPPRGSELAVRAALARAARLAGNSDTTSHAQAARLYAAILARYPRTSYVTLIYAGLWRVRAHTAYDTNPGAWLEEVFAHFHNSCFGTWALDVFMGDVPKEEARPKLSRLVGLYPDTKLSRAAGRYL